MAPTPDQYPAIVAPLSDVETERLVLRRFRADDLDPLATMFAKPEVWRYPYGRGFTRDETHAFLDAQIAEWNACGFGCWVATERETGRMVGYVGLSVPTFMPEILPAVEVGWRFDPDVWGRGYATEGAVAALDEAFTTLGLDQVCSLPASDNIASVRVAERVGLRRDRVAMIPANERRGEVEVVVFLIGRDDWCSRVLP